MYLYMAKKKFEQEPGSIDSMLNKLPWAVRLRYKRNQSRARADARAMETWAARGFVSGDVDNWADDEPSFDRPVHTDEDP